LAYLVLVAMHGAEDRRAGHRKAMRTSNARLPIGTIWSPSFSTAPCSPGD